MLSIEAGETKVPQPLRDAYDLDHISSYGANWTQVISTIRNYERRKTKISTNYMMKRTKSFSKDSCEKAGLFATAMSAILIISARLDGNGQAQGDKVLFIKERFGMDSIPGRRER